MTGVRKGVEKGVIERDRRCEKVSLVTAMESSTKPRTRGRTPKRTRSAEELVSLSRVFAADWHPGDNVMTWIRRHEGTTMELSTLVRDGWSWADVGRALALAGICYRSGTPISAHILGNKAALARSEERARQAALRKLAPALPVSVEHPPVVPDPMPVRTAALSGTRTVPVLPAEPVPAVEEIAPEFQFRPASLKNWSGTRIVKDKPPEPTPPPPQPPSEDADEVIARLFRRK